MKEGRDPAEGPQRLSAARPNPPPKAEPAPSFSKTLACSWPIRHEQTPPAPSSHPRLPSASYPAPPSHPFSPPSPPRSSRGSGPLPPGGLRGLPGLGTPLTPPPGRGVPYLGTPLPPSLLGARPPRPGAGRACQPQREEVLGGLKQLANRRSC